MTRFCPSCSCLRVLVRVVALHVCSYVATYVASRSTLILHLLPAFTRSSRIRRSQAQQAKKRAQTQFVQIPANSPKPPTMTSNSRTYSRIPVSLETFSLEVADDFFQLPGDCSPFDTGPGAPCLFSPDDTPFDLALSISEGGGQNFDLTLKGPSTHPSPTPEAFLCGGNYSSEEQYPTPLVPFTVVVSSSPTFDVPTMGATGATGTPTTKQAAYTPTTPISNTSSEPAVADPKAEAIISGIMIEALSATNSTKQAQRVLRRSPRRSNATSTPTASSIQRPATRAAITCRNGVSTRRTASISAAKVSVHGAGAIGGVAVSRATNGGTKRVGTGAKKMVGAGTKMAAPGTKKNIASTKKVAVVKKKAVAKRSNHQCQNCGRMFGDEGLKYHLRNSVCLKGKDTSKAVSFSAFKLSSCLTLVLKYAMCLQLAHTSIDSFLVTQPAPLGWKKPKAKRGI